MYLFSVLAFNISKPWRKDFWTNIPLLLVVLMALAYNILATLIKEADWEVFELVHLHSQQLRVYLLI